MKLRAPSVPLIAVDPYFSVWSPADKLYDSTTEHWTASPNTMLGFVTVDGETFRFMGDGKTPVIEQIFLDMRTLETHYAFSNDKITLELRFFTPLFPDDLYRLSRPVSYMQAAYFNNDDAKHEVSIKILASEELCLDKAGQYDVTVESVRIDDNLSAMKMGSTAQKILGEQGDDLRIDWGYFYLCGPAGSKNYSEKFKPDYFDDDEGCEMTFVATEFSLEPCKPEVTLFAYDDIYSLEYFHKKVVAYWKIKGITIEQAIAEAYYESEEMLDKCIDNDCNLAAECSQLALDLYKDTFEGDFDKYIDLLTLGYRQLLAAHKLAVDENGEVIYISKECFSNGCTATVDVTYPSAPFFLLYNIELLKGMLRPIFKYSLTDEWKYDFAPHDVGTYPLVNGQRYCWDNKGDEEKYLRCQMPVEECGNMLVLMANIAMLENKTDFADENMDLLDKWVKYLIEYGEDPANQLCTDDFAGHLAHNCNLSLKAIMGIAGYSIILKMQGKADEAEKYMDTAKAMADSWVERAANEDGSFRLAFDKPDSFSMKYNIVWDKLWKTKLFAPSVIYSEFASNKKRINAYGMPLDNRATYTKSDWLVWTATLAPTREEFMEFITPMWNGFNVSPSRVPMTDWYDTNSSLMIGFRHRTVQGGLFIKLLENKF